MYFALSSSGYCSLANIYPFNGVFEDLTGPNVHQYYRRVLRMT